MRQRLAPSMLAAAASLLAVPLAAQAGQGTDPAKLVAQLADGDARTRLDAYRELQRQRPANLPQLLEGQLEAMPQHGQQLASNLLRSVRGALRRRLDEKLLASEAPYLRAIGAGALLRLYQQTGDEPGRRQAIEAMATALRDCDARTELAAVLQELPELGEGRDTALFDALRAQLAPDLPSHIAEQILRHLRASARDAATESAVRGLAEAKDRRVRAAALAFLARDGGDAVEALIAFLDEHDDVLMTVVSQLEGAPRLDGRLDDRLVSALLGRFAAVGAPHELSRLVRLLSGQAGSRIAPALGAVLDHEDDKLRDAALKELAGLPGGLSDKVARELLQSSSALARVIAADSLRKRDDRSGLDAVLEAAGTAGPHRAEAARVLGEFRARDGVPVLLGLLDDGDANVRSRAWSALQLTWQSLFPFRRFDFATAGYDPNAAQRGSGIAALRRFWQSLEDQGR